MFRTDLVSIIKSLNTVFIAIVICHMDAYCCEYLVHLVGFY